MAVAWGELGVGRGQIELLAGLFHADAPNDLAPSAYNEDDSPRGLPASPLAPRPGPPAFAGRRRRAHRAPRTSSACVIAVVVGWIRRLAEAPTTLGVAVLRQTGRLDVV